MEFFNSRIEQFKKLSAIQTAAELNVFAREKAVYNNGVFVVITFVMPHFNEATSELSSKRIGILCYVDKDTYVFTIGEPLFFPPQTTYRNVCSELCRLSPQADLGQFQNFPELAYQLGTTVMPEEAIPLISDENFTLCIPKLIEKIVKLEFPIVTDTAVDIREIQGTKYSFIFTKQDFKQLYSSEPIIPQYLARSRLNTIIQSFERTHTPQELLILAYSKQGFVIAEGAYAGTPVIFNGLILPQRYFTSLQFNGTTRPFDGFSSKFVFAVDKSGLIWEDNRFNSHIFPFNIADLYLDNLSLV